MRYKCIYCLEEKTEDKFNKEHVIPKRLGVFKKNNITLINKVCMACNKNFGDTIDLIFLRDSIEGALRFKYGVRKPDSFKTKGLESKLRYKVKSGKFIGRYVYIEFNAKDDRIVSMPANQVGFQKRDSDDDDFVFFPYQDLPAKKELYNMGFDHKGKDSKIILGDDKERTLTRLKKLGHDIKDLKYFTEDVDEKEAWIEISREIDDNIIREIAKIGFNYLAYHLHSCTLIGTSFNTIRDFIFKGSKTGSFLGFIDRPLLQKNSETEERYKGHAIKIFWDDKIVGFVAFVSIFNLFTYKIPLCKNFSPICAMKNGHYFDIKKKELFNLNRYKLNIWNKWYSIEF